MSRSRSKARATNTGKRKSYIKTMNEGSVIKQKLNYTITAKAGRQVEVRRFSAWHRNRLHRWDTLIIDLVAFKSDFKGITFLEICFISRLTTKIPKLFDIFDFWDTYKTFFLSVKNNYFQHHKIRTLSINGRCCLSPSEPPLIYFLDCLIDWRSGFFAAFNRLFRARDAIV